MAFADWPFSFPIRMLYKRIRPRPTLGVVASRQAMGGARLSDRRRKYSENSVVASIGQIQAMLAADEPPTRPPQPPRAPRSIAPADAPPPPDEAELARPVAMPVSPGQSLVVPSWEEVQDNRAARWANESQSAVVVRNVPRWRRWRVHVLWGAAAIALVAATIATMWWSRPMATDSRPFAEPYQRALHAAEIAGQAHQAQRALAEMQAQRDTLTRERDALKARVEAAEAQARDAAVVAAAVANARPDTKKKPRVKRRRKSRRRVSKRSTSRRRVKRTSRATKTDKNLEGLLNSL